MTTQIQKLDITVKLGAEVNADMLFADLPDAVILATGTIDNIPKIPGAENIHATTATNVLTHKAVVGLDVAVIGGDMTGCEVAEFLADKGMKVTIVEVLDKLMPKRSQLVSMALIQRIKMKGVKAITGVIKEEIINHALKVITKEKEVFILPVDTIVYATGGQPNNTLNNDLKDQVSEVYTIGDCSEPRDILAAIEEGHHAGCLV